MRDTLELKAAIKTVLNDQEIDSQSITVQRKTVSLRVYEGSVVIALAVDDANEELFRALQDLGLDYEEIQIVESFVKKEGEGHIEYIVVTAQFALQGGTL